MKHNPEYEIAWLGLKDGPHVYEYSVDDRFMKEHFAPEDYSDWEAKVVLRFDKHPGFFRLHFDVGGAVTLACDRCGDDFRMTLWDEFDLVVKLTEEGDDAPAEDEADIVFIPRSQAVIDVSEWLYEFIMLSVPVQRIHPDRPDGTSGCNPDALKLLTRLADDEPAAGEEESDEKPLWKALEALKENQPKKRKTN